MTLCLTHPMERETLCSCSKNYEKGRTLANILQSEFISVSDFYSFLQEKYDLNHYSVDNQIEFNRYHVLLAREMVSANIWKDIDQIISECKNINKKRAN